MYLRMGFHSRSQVDIQLDRDDCTLEDLLDEDDIVQEAKSHNMKLIEFLVKKSNLTKLIKYVSIQPNLEEIKKNKKKENDNKDEQQQQQQEGEEDKKKEEPSTTTTEEEKKEEEDKMKEEENTTATTTTTNEKTTTETDENKEDTSNDVSEKKDENNVEKKEDEANKETTTTEEESSTTTTTATTTTEEEEEEVEKKVEEEPKKEDNNTTTTTTEGEEEKKEENNVEEETKDTTATTEEEKKEEEEEVKEEMVEEGEEENKFSTQTPEEQIEQLEPLEDSEEEDDYDDEEDEYEESLDEERNSIDKLMIKYPQLACDILSCDIEILYDEIVSSDHLMNLLFAFLKKKDPNPNFESNWIKVVLSMFQRKPFKVLKYIYENKDLVSDFIDHVGTFDLQELLLRLMGCEPVDEDENTGSLSLSSQIKLKMFNTKESEFTPHSIAKWWMEQNVIELLFAKMDPQYEEEVHTHTTFIIAEFILRSTKDLESDINPLAQKFLSKETVGKFMEILLKYSNSTVLIEGIPLLSVFIETGFNIMITRKEKKIPEAILLILYKVKDLVSFLEDPGKVDSITTPVQTLKVPMGSSRLKIIEFLSQLFRINSPTVETELIKAKIVPVVMDLVLKYEYNNFLHNLFLSLVGYILGGESDTIKKHLLFDCDLCSMIIKGYKINGEAVKKSKGMRKGFMGHLTIIANKLISETQQVVIDALLRCKEWENFVNTDLAAVNDLESKQLGGPLPSSIDSDQEDFDRHFQGFDDDDDDDDEDDFEEDEYRLDDDESASDEEETMVNHNEEAYDMSDSESDSDDETFITKDEHHQQQQQQQQYDDEEEEEGDHQQEQENISTDTVQQQQQQEDEIQDPQEQQQDEVEEEQDDGDVVTEAKSQDQDS